MSETPIRTLILLRHAKSDWGESLVDDHDRPLNQRGRLAAPMMGAWMTEMALSPDTVLCSTATRARQTCDGLGLTAPVVYDRALYLASSSQMLSQLRHTPDDVESVLMIGHNPGIEALAQALASTPHTAPQHMPTAAAVVLRAAAPWRNWAPKMAEVVLTAEPKTLV